MSKVCKNCGENVDDNEVSCRKCGKPIDMNLNCLGNEVSIDTNDEYHMPYEGSNSFMDLKDIRKIKHRIKLKKKGNRLYNAVLNKIIFILLIVCIITMGSYYLLRANKDVIIDKSTLFAPKKHTSMDVIYQFKNIKELQALKINKADFYKYTNQEKYADLIIRYSIFINFNLEDVNVTENDDGSFIVEMKKPDINPILLDGIDYTKDKKEDTYPGVEIFDVSNSWALGPDFKLGEETYRDIAEKYIGEQCELDSAFYTNKAFDSLKEKLMDISQKLDLNISEIRLEGASE
jgi:hypothetical protein